MYASDIEFQHGKAKRTALVYGGVSLFCGLFSFVYEHYSHGVISWYMVLLFLYPLAGGLLPFLAISQSSRLPGPARISRNLYHGGLATLCMGSCIAGVLEIYGTSSPYLAVYWVVGCVLTGVAVALYYLQIVSRR